MNNLVKFIESQIETLVERWPALYTVDTIWKTGYVLFVQYMSLLAEARFSISLQLFRAHHFSKLDRSFWATDIDLILVDGQNMVSIIDYKSGGMEITFTEAVVYPLLMEKFNIPVFIILGPRDPKEGGFIVERLVGIDEGSQSHNIRTTRVVFLENWNDFNTWEQNMRKMYYTHRDTLVNLDARSYINYLEQTN